MKKLVAICLAAMFVSTSNAIDICIVFTNGVFTPTVILTEEIGFAYKIDYMDYLGPITNGVDVNTASLAQLDTLTGIGPVYAPRIIEGRPYSSVDDLLRVDGIGPITLQKIKDQGLAYVGYPPANHWNVLATVTITNQPQFYLDISAIGQPKRFYRLTQIN